MKILITGGTNGIGKGVANILANIDVQAREIISHFQVNYLSQFMLTLNLLDLLKKSTKGGRVIFNATRMGEILWEDIQWNISLKLCADEKTNQIAEDLSFDKKGK